MGLAQCYLVWFGLAGMELHGAAGRGRVRPVWIGVVR